MSELYAAPGFAPVIAIDDARDAVALAGALPEGRLDVAEITFGNAAAAQMSATPKDARPELLVGTDAVLNFDSLKAAVAAGERFGLEPEYDPEIFQSVELMKRSFAPGVIAPSELCGAKDFATTRLRFAAPIRMEGA
jgi:2-dehydro-3-deoxyphosphogluconate aldolase/(4S)-4-hydroxy-2-oxoglutarate aldolase